MLCYHFDYAVPDTALLDSGADYGAVLGAVVGSFVIATCLISAPFYLHCNTNYIQDCPNSVCYGMLRILEIILELLDT